MIEQGDAVLGLLSESESFTAAAISLTLRRSPRVLYLLNHMV
jgi:hypothetical protein